MENPLCLKLSLLIEFIICVLARDVKLIPEARNSNPMMNNMLGVLKTIVSVAGLFGLYNDAENHRKIWLMIVKIKPIVIEIDLFKYLSEIYPTKIGNRNAKL